MNILGETDLWLQPLGLPPYTARGCIETLIPAGTGAFYRTINGVLRSCAAPGQQKYQVSIRCRDHHSPTFNGLWPGTPLGVGCLTRLSQVWRPATGEGGEPSIFLDRPPIPGSLHVYEGRGQALDFHIADQKVSFQPLSVEEGVEIFVSYRPFLQMQVKTFSIETEEWTGMVSWSLTCLEV